MSTNAQAHHLGFKIHILDLANDEHRQTTKSLITKETKPSIHQLDQSDLTHQQLLEIINSFEDESTLEELNLESLESISGGLGLPESLISSTILMIMVSSASGLFADSMGAINKTSVQDALNAGISANIEEVRNDLAGHLLNTTTGEYEPGTTSNLGTTFLSTYSDEDTGLDGNQTTVTIGDQQLVRTITADGNTIEVTYSHDGESSAIQRSTMVSPAAGWLP